MDTEMEETHEMVDPPGCSSRLESLWGEYGKWAVAGAFLVAMHGWIVAAIVLDFSRSIFLLVVVSLFWLYVVGSFLLDRISFSWFRRVEEWLAKRQWLSTVLGLLSMLLLFALLIFFAWGRGPRLYSTGCIVVIVIVSILISDKPSRIKWRPVVSGMLLQYALAFLVIRWRTGTDAVQFVADKIVGFLGFAKVGTGFTFNYIPSPPDICGMEGPFAFTSLPIIVYFSALCALWYYYGIIQWVLRRVSVLLQWTMGTTAAESLNAVASAFMGPTETAVMMRYALPSMTESEIVSTMAVNYSMISGSLFATYISYGACAPLLLAANVMSAPATLLVAKIVSPEVQKSRQQDMKTFQFPPCEDMNPLQALSNGAIAAIQIILGYAFFPVAFLMGSSNKADWGEYIQETLKVAQLIGSKTIYNEFVAYQKMQGMLLRGEIGPRGQMIAVFALCGYSNPSNIGSVLAQFAAMCPQRMRTLVPAATKGLWIGCLACFLTACVAGSLIDDSSLSCSPSDAAGHCLDLERVRHYVNQTQ